jgi:hypothetical protein
LTDLFVLGSGQLLLKINFKFGHEISWFCQEEHFRELKLVDCLIFLKGKINMMQNIFKANQMKLDFKFVD